VHHVGYYSYKLEISKSSGIQSDQRSTKQTIINYGAASNDVQLLTMYKCNVYGVIGLLAVDFILKKLTRLIA
jgi:hypothetical protein